MPIKFTFKKLPVDADGKAYPSLEEFQAAELKKLLQCENSSSSVFDDIVVYKEEVIEILELTMDARPGARGVKKPRKQNKPAAANAALQDQDA